MLRIGRKPRMEKNNVMPRNLLAHNLALAAVLMLSAASCAVQGGPGEAGTPASSSQTSSPAARLGLAPALRPLYDALEGEGDWVLVEPQGWVFRPRVNSVAWRPYEDGHWEPSYAFGWVWESHDPFGWITDHYGFWFYDDFQGWLWKPYGAWAPSWVAWVQVGNFIAWAPLPPPGTTPYGDVPGGVFTYVSLQQLAQPSSGASSSASYVRSLPDDGSPLVPIDRTTAYMGTYYNAGPELNEVLGNVATEQLRLGERDGSVEVPVPTRKPAAAAGPAPSLTLSALETRTRGAWGAARREFESARPYRASGGAPSPTPPPPAAQDPPHFKPAPDAADTLHQGTPADSLKKHWKR